MLRLLRRVPTFSPLHSLQGSLYSPHLLFGIPGCAENLEGRFFSGMGIRICPFFETGKVVGWSAFRMRFEQRRACQTTIVPVAPAVEDNPLLDLALLPQCQSGEEISRLSIPLVNLMSIREIMAVLRHLKRFPEELQKELMDSLMARLLEIKDNLQPASVSFVFNVCARVGYHDNPEFFEALLGETNLPFQIEGLSHRGTSVLMMSLGLMIRNIRRQRKEEKWEVDQEEIEITNQVSKADQDSKELLCPSENRVMESLLRRFVTVTEFDTVDAWHVVNAFYGSASTKISDPDLLKRLTDMAVHGPIFRELADEGLATIINSIGYLDYCDHEALDFILSEVLRPERLSAFSNDALLSVVNGLCILKFHDRPVLMTLLEEVIRPWRVKKYGMRDFCILWTSLAQFGFRDTSILDPLMKEAMHPRRMQEMPAKSLVAVGMSMAKLKYRNNDFVHAFVNEVCSERRQDSQEVQHYPQYIYILGQLQYNNSNDVRKLLKRLFESVNLGDLPSKTLSSIIYALSECHVYDESYVNAILEEVSKQERLESMTPHSLSSLIHSLGHMQREISPAFMKILFEATKHERLVQYTEYGLVAVVHGLTHFDIDDANMLQRVFAEVRKPRRLIAYEPQALTCLALGVTIMHNRDMALIGQLAEEIVKIEKLRNLNKTAIMSLIVNFAEMKFEDLDIVEKLLRVVVNSQEISLTHNSNLSAFVYALGQLKYNNSKDIIMPIIDELTNRRSSFRCLEMAAVINGLGHMGIKCEEYFTLQHLISDALRTDRISKYTVKEAGRVVSGLSLMNYSSPDIQPLLDRLLNPSTFTDLSFRDLSATLYSLGNAGIKEKRMVDQIKSEVSRRGIVQDVNQRYLSLLLQGIGTMSDEKDHSFGQMLLEMLHREYGHRTEELTNQNISAILYGLGQIGVLNKTMLYPFILESIKTSRLQQYSIHGLATLVFGLGQFRFHDRAALMPVVQEVCRPQRVKYYKNRQIMGTIFSLCHMGVHQEDLMQPLLKAATYPTELQKCSGDELSMLFFSLSRIRPTDDSYLLSALEEVVGTDRLDSMSDNAIGAILYSAFSLRESARSPKILRPIVDRLSCPGRLEKMNPDALGTIVFSLGRLNFLPEDFMDLVAEEVTKPKKLKKINETSLCNIINCAGRVKYDNKRMLAALMEEVTNTDRLQSYHEGHLQNIIFGLASLRFRHPRFISYLDRILSDVNEVNKLSPKVLVFIIHCYVILQLGSDQIVTAATQSVLANPERRADLNDAQLSSLMNSLGQIQRNGKSRPSGLSYCKNPSTTFIAAARPTRQPQGRLHFFTCKAAEDDAVAEDGSQGEVNSNVCPGCGIDLDKAPRGCDREGHISSGIGSVVGFDWWPIKAYRPCPAFEAAGKKYVRKGQITNEILFRRKDETTL